MLIANPKVKQTQSAVSSILCWRICTVMEAEQSYSFLSPFRTEDGVCFDKDATDSQSPPDQPTKDNSLQPLLHSSQESLDVSSLHATSI